ncbi:Laccase [Parasponia andersonii]|uniref:Laccase n=1 Tax=Parasponia andersonii TaxID=3476 RepID=A0A2P5API5_PARAD|nr:Laccase [Parasponia andersonii]
MAKSLSSFLLACTIVLLASLLASATIVEHSLYIKNLTVNHLCHDQVIVAANGSFPGPTISVHEGDTLVVHVVNHSPYNISIHWHGIFQLLSGWADGAEYATQCPIRPGHSYTYRFNIIGQEGTLWWHAHSSWLRATVHGALIIYPRPNPLKRLPYPFPTPYEEVPIILGEWWNANVIDVLNEGLAIGITPNLSDALNINGQVGDLYKCSNHDMYRLKVVPGKTYLLRIINAVLNHQMFFNIAKHTVTVVAVDASYTNRYVTDIVVIAPGQTVDVLFTSNQPIGSYYMAAQPYYSVPRVIPFGNRTTRGIIVYEGSTSSTPMKTALPSYYDDSAAFKFYNSLTGLADGPHWVPVPLHVDKYMFITVGLNNEPCKSKTGKCPGPLGGKVSASMNNHSFVLPNTLSMLQAFYYGVSGIYTTDFPDYPPFKFDYTNLSLNESFMFAPKGTYVKKLNYNDVVEIVFQNTAMIETESHPIHLHGFNFHVLAQGFGNYNAREDRTKFNIVNPQIRNTVAVPSGGWAVIRFQANNPGIWLMHCHVDRHMPVGLATAFEVKNGPTPSSILPPPPEDLPKCFESDDILNSPVPSQPNSLSYPNFSRGRRSYYMELNVGRIAHREKK